MASESKIEKLLNALDKCMSEMRKADFAAAPGEREPWRDLDDLYRDCQRDVRKFGPESLLEPDEEEMEEEEDDLGPIGCNPDPHLRGLP